ncbi:MAG: hypothetical protein ACEPO8_01980 [Rhodothermaceae bacterium]
MSKNFISIKGTKEFFEFNIADGYTLELKSTTREFFEDPVKGKYPMGTFNFIVREKLPIEVGTNKITFDAGPEHKYIKIVLNIKNPFGKVVKAQFDNSLELHNTVNDKQITIPNVGTDVDNLSVTRFQFHEERKLLVDASLNGTICDLSDFYSFPKRLIEVNKILTEDWVVVEDPEVDTRINYEEEDDTP